MIQVHVVTGGVYGVPRELVIAGTPLVAVTGNDGELIGEVLGLHQLLNGAVGELTGDADRFEDQPALQETFGVHRLHGCRRPHERRPEATSSRALGASVIDIERGGEDAQNRQRHKTRSAARHGVLMNQRSRSLSGRNLVSVGMLLPTADSASGSFVLGTTFGMMR